MSSAKAKLPQEFPYFVRLVGWTQDQGGLKGFEEETKAIAHRDTLNAKAVEMGIKARYEVVTTS